MEGNKYILHVKLFTVTTGCVCKTLGFQGGFLLGLFYGPEDGGDMFLQNVRQLSMDPR